MKKLLLFFICTSFLNTSFSQTPSDIETKALKSFQSSFNSKNYEKLFNQFGENMQSLLPLEKAILYFTDLNNQLGNIEAYEFNKVTTRGFSSYKTAFTNGVFSLNLAVNKDSKITGLFIEPFKNESLPVLEKNSSSLILPFNNTWTVTWGGDTVEQNYHVESKAQKNAFDFVITDSTGKSYRTDGKTNEDYYAFGKELIAPCDAEVVLVVDGVKDNIPGELNPIYVPGNTVILKTKNNEFLFFAHFKQHSIEVAQGDMVKQGELLGLCGNSGNSSETHLHYHIQNIEDMNNATGAKSYFETIMVNDEIKKNYSPVQGDKIKNIN